MTSRERVWKAIRREPSDRPATSLRCTPEVWTALQQHFGVSTPADVLDELDIDFRWANLVYCGPPERGTATLAGNGRDLWGCLNKGISNEFNTYFEIVEHPLAKFTTAEEIMEYDWPSLDWWDYGKIKDSIREHKKKDDRAIMFFAGGAFETPWYMRGMEQFFIDLYESPEIVTAICQKVREYYYQRALRVLDAADGEIDVIGSGGDLGGQDCMMIHPDTWRELILPHTSGLITPFKEMGLGTYYHSCGSVFPIIGDLADVGLDILDPIQVTAKDMQPEKLFPAYGDRISFHGAIDEVELLPHATAEEVYAETTRIISVLGQNHGYFVSPSHQVQGDTSVENILAIFKAAKDFRY